MMPVKWKVNETTFVYIEEDDDGRHEIWIKQDDDDHICLSQTGASAESLIRALICAVEAAGWDMPELEREGYDRNA